MSTLRVLIVDDEPLARKGIRQHLSGFTDIEIIGECGSGWEAVELIKAERPDIVFLDVQMPELDGFGVIEQVGVENMPELIFVTAYDQYTLDAFDVQALDYVLKPINPQRFQRALERARERVRTNAVVKSHERLLSILDLIQQRLRPVERLAIKSAERIFFIEVEDIDWIESAGNYVRIFSKGQSHLLHETLNALEKKLDPARFLRIHRSRIVNVGRIKELQPLFHGEYVILLKDGTQITSGRTYREQLQSLFRN
jgi:two-component system LytT family response regulator